MFKTDVYSAVTSPCILNPYCEKMAFFFFFFFFFFAVLGSISDRYISSFKKKTTAPCAACDKKDTDQVPYTTNQSLKKL